MERHRLFATPWPGRYRLRWFEVGADNLEKPVAGQGERTFDLLEKPGGQRLTCPYTAEELNRLTTGGR